jgi:hypothetical protein
MLALEGTFPEVGVVCGSIPTATDQMRRGAPTANQASTGIPRRALSTARINPPRVLPAYAGFHAPDIYKLHPFRAAGRSYFSHFPSRPGGDFPGTRPAGNARPQVQAEHATARVRSQPDG